MWQPITDPKQIQRAMAGYPCWLEMDLDNLRFNLANIRSRVGVEVMPVVKNGAFMTKVYDGSWWPSCTKLT